MFSFGKKSTAKRPKLTKSIPPLILNKMWHDLFQGKKPSTIQKQEKKLENLVKRYGQIKQELKEYETLKKQLMDGILADMGNISESGKEKLDKKMDTNTNLIKDINSRIENSQDEILDLPSKIDDCNDELAYLTAEVFYPILIENTALYESTLQEIDDLKSRLRNCLTKKVDLEEANAKIYHGLHQVMGSDALDKMDEYFIGKQMRRKSYDLKGQVVSDNSVFLEEANEEEK